MAETNDWEGNWRTRFATRPIQSTTNYRFLIPNKLFIQIIDCLSVCLDRTYFAETENWKHCSKIIFKCVNSTVGPIFNEKVAEKWDLWVHEQYIDALFTVKKSTFAVTVQ